MASRPAKRKRRGTIVHSDEDDELRAADIPLRTPKKQTQLEFGSQHGSPLSLSPGQTRSQLTKAASRKTSATSRKTNTTSSPKRTPKKPNKSTQRQEPEKNKRLSIFFGKATEEQRWHRESAAPEDDGTDGEAGDSIIDDDLSDDALLDAENENSGQTRKSLDRRKDAVTNGLKVAPKISDVLPLSTQRFVKPFTPIKPISTKPDTGDAQAWEEQHRPWADRFGPTNLGELAIHKKKVQDVQIWLDGVLSARSQQRLLLLRGPAGSGKTTTISLLAQILAVQLVPWQNPISSDAATTGSVAGQFNDFLNSGGQFGTLAFIDDISSTMQTSSRTVFLVEEFPTTMTRSSGLDLFQSIILLFLARPSTAPSGPFRSEQSSPNPPLVMVVSETLLSSSTAFSDSFTAHRLLGPEILNHPLVTVIDFNPVAPTFITKALDLVIKKEARCSRRRRMPGPGVIQRLVEAGDVRSAVNTLEFLCVRDNQADWSGTVAAKPKKSRDEISMTEMEKSSLKLVSQRETTLDMFHAAGKIVYNKREDPKPSNDNTEMPAQPPDHLMHLHIPKPSQVDIEVLLNETGTDIQTFISTLHENYVLSCNGDAFVDSLDLCSDTLSISDVLNPDSRRQLHSKSSMTAAIQANIAGSSNDALRQDEISFNVATLGLLFNLPFPVNRAAPSSGRKADSYKMFYPASLRLWKPTEENHSLISLFASSIDGGEAVSGNVRDGVAAWKSSSFGSVHTSSDSNEDAAASNQIRKLRSTTDELTLEILPYLGQIRHARKQDVKILQKITGLPSTSIHLQRFGDEPEEEEMREESARQSEKVNTASQFVAGSTVKSTIWEKDNVADVDVDTLYLEDDDIVDD